MPTAAQNALIELQELLKIEQEEDYRQYREKIQINTIEDRKEGGITWYPVIKSGQFISTGERVTLSLQRTTGEQHPSNFQVGSVVSVFKGEAGRERQISGVISYLNKEKMRVVLHDSEVPDWLDDGKLGVNLLFDEVSYKEMNLALEIVAGAERGRIAALREILYGAQEATFQNGYDYDTPSLNKKQNEALTKVINARDLAIIHGPPGTGKTTTLVQAIKATVTTEKQVLVCAPSNAAVDLLVEKLIEEEVGTLRLGHPARLTENVIENSLDVKISRHPQFKDLKESRRKAEELRKIGYKYKRNFGKQERRQRDRILKEASMLKAYSRDIESYIINHLLESAQVIACTVTGANQAFLKDKAFKTVFIDECSQALEPACWIPVIKGQRVIMAGDHCQLPPTVKSLNAAKNGLEVSLFEKAISNTRTDTMLEVQYRMAPQIMGFSSQYFYQNKLKTAEEVLARPDEVLFEFIDTAGCGFRESQDKSTLSTYNKEEAQLLIKHLCQHPPESGLNAGIIAPYKAQIKLLDEMLREENCLDAVLENIRINTVDAFQGQERDVIYISLVRSNNKSEIGFLKEYRRMNVAMTRAKSTLVIVGDSATLGNDPFYRQMIDYVEKNGKYASAFEYLYD